MHVVTASGGSVAQAARERSGQRGQTLVLFSLFVVVFLGAAALTIDYGSWLSARRNYQAVADSAALAGSHYLVPPDSDSPGACGSRQTCARFDSWRYLNEHLGLGLSDAQILATYASVDSGAAGTAVGGYTIWVDTPPGNAGSAYPGSIGANNRVVFVRIQSDQQPYFARIMGLNSVTVPAWATAGTFPNRFAVITLRRGNASGAIDSGPSNAGDIRLAGNTTALNVVNGDVGGNWSMVLNSNNTLRMYSTLGTNYQPAPYLKVPTSCGQSCWMNGQLTDQAGNTLSTQFPPNGALQLPGFIQDPNYAPPPELASNAPNGPTAQIPVGDGGGSPTISTGTVVNDAGGNPLTCAASSPHLGPGTYSSIIVKNGGCLILDPVNRYSDPTNPATATPVSSGQRPGIFYITGKFDLQQGVVVGDGVTVIIRPSGASQQFTPGSHSILDLNTGKVSGSPQILGGWTTKGASPYAWNGLAWVYQSSQESNAVRYGRGLAMYVLKPSQYQVSPAVDANTTVIQVNSGAGLAWSGITYAPHDNVAIAGQPSHSGVGQLVSWTFTFNGGTDVTQTYDGPAVGYPILIEPCASGDQGACQ
ncbi:MAG TPA: pilus assembly protein TadG-related protein [Humisphaera sp.]